MRIWRNTRDNSEIRAISFTPTAIGGVKKPQNRNCFERLTNVLVVPSQSLPKATTTTLFYSSAATPKAKKQIDEERLNHEDRVVNITKLSIQELHPEISKLHQLPDQNERLADDQSRPKTAKKKDELAWRITPSAELNQLVNHYLMLSKIRLTCKLKESLESHENY